MNTTNFKRLKTRMSIVKTNYTLWYHKDNKRLTDPIRIAFYYNGLRYVNCPVTRDDWESHKEYITLYDDLPFLEVETDSQQYNISGSNVILRYVGKLGTYRFYPMNAIDAALVDEVLSLIDAVAMQIPYSVGLSMLLEIIPCCLTNRTVPCLV